MSVLMVPPADAEPWPSLGGQVCDFIEANLVYGPGDLRGQPYKLDPETRALIWRTYEVYPMGSQDASGRDISGRRRFKRVAWSMPKGTAKTEKAALITACELDPEAPVRCDGFRGKQPIGRPVADPYIPMVAYTEEMSDELAYYALKTILEESTRAREYDIGLERIMRLSGDGRAVSVATAPNARDGARTTFQVFDETHRLTLPRQRRAFQTMLNNIPKRYLADAWSMEITTAYGPGENSVAEDTMNYARQIQEGKARNAQLFFFHRQASDHHDTDTVEGARAAVIEASGPHDYRDTEAIVSMRFEPDTDIAYWERVWCNRPVQAASKAFDLKQWNELGAPGYVIPDGAAIALGFDGSRYHDATGLVATEIKTGRQMLLGSWEDSGIQGWQVPELEVDALMNEAFERWKVWLGYFDPYWWESWIAQWQGRWEKEVKVFETNRIRAMGRAVKTFRTAIQLAEVSHCDQEVLTRHIGNACRKVFPTLRDDEGDPVSVIEKERPDSPFKIDAGVAAVLSWQAYLDAIADGALDYDDGPSVYETQEMTFL
jgi:hypothetical protein